MTPTHQKFVDLATTLFETYGSCQRNDNDDHVCADGHIAKCQEHWFDENDMILHIALALQTSHDEGVREEREACMDAVRDVIGERFDTNGDLLAALKAIEARQRSSK